MPLALNDGGQRTTSALSEVNNDTGRIAFCGPYVIAAITGWSISKIEAEIHRLRDLPDERQPEQSKQVIRGTTNNDVGMALAAFGYCMVPVASYMHLARKERPTLWSWMQKPRNAWTYYLLAVHKGKEGHWILIKGVKMCDTFTDGRWQFVCDGPHRGARIMEVFTVRRRRN